MQHNSVYIDMIININDLYQILRYFRKTMRWQEWYDQHQHSFLPIQYPGVSMFTNVTSSPWNWLGKMQLFYSQS